LNPLLTISSRRQSYRLRRASRRQWDNYRAANRITLRCFHLSNGRRRAEVLADNLNISDLAKTGCRRSTPFLPGAVVVVSDRQVRVVQPAHLWVLRLSVLEVPKPQTIKCIPGERAPPGTNGDDGVI